MSRANSRNYAFPLWMFVPAAIAVLVVVGPLLGLVIKIPWHRAEELLSAPSAVAALKLSLGTAVTATVLCILVGLPLSLLLAQWARHRGESRGGRGATLIPVMGGGVAFVVYAPLVLSPVVSGLALMYFWGRNGLLGQFLASAGLSVSFTPWAVVLAQVFVSLPFFVSTAVTALSSIPRRFEEIAATEGARRGEIMRKVLLPIAAPGLITASLLSFARALGEFGATITFAGNIDGVTRTIPLNIELGLSSDDVDAALGSCIMLLALYIVVVALLVLARWLGGLRQR
ncbi:ABC transporter permease [uncultured Kocuria sp.]|uniref:ABC transporter permease n=1 Tax=uncultured Kocuria sp. TaxID=259305 RepID=UPI0025969384|nr:ABC transporter permease subunit [uncultured Kocuria sp.]MCT1367342.1 ABC transporter permease subunit [Rothia sp. p3-SID1597]